MNENNKPLPDFVFEAPATIEWPVTVVHPVDGGEMASFQFTGIFARLSEDDLDALLGVPEQIQPADAQAVPLAPVKRMAETLKENAGLFARVLKGWRGPKNADGTDAAFTVERLYAVTTGANGPFFSEGVWKAVYEIRHGARLGN